MDAALGPISGEWLGAISDVGVTEPQGGFQAIVLNLVVAVP
jgi:hypothetical protein